MQLKKVTPYVIGAMVGFGLTMGGFAVAKVPGLLNGAGMLGVVMQMNLDQEQQESLRAFHGDAEVIHDELRELHEQNFGIVSDELRTDKPDRELIHDLVDDGLGTVRDVMHERVDAFLDIHATFDPKQREIFVDGLTDVRAERSAFVEDLREKMKEHHRAIVEDAR